MLYCIGYSLVRIYTGLLWCVQTSVANTLVNVKSMYFRLSRTPLPCPVRQTGHRIPVSTRMPEYSLKKEYCSSYLPPDFIAYKQKGQGLHVKLPNVPIVSSAAPS